MILYSFNIPIYFWPLELVYVRKNIYIYKTTVYVHDIYSLITEYIINCKFIIVQDIVAKKFLLQLQLAQPRFHTFLLSKGGSYRKSLLTKN